MDVVAAPGLPMSVEAVAAGAGRARPATNLVALVHAESASGILNPLPEIARPRQGARRCRRGRRRGVGRRPRTGCRRARHRHRGHRPAKGARRIVRPLRHLRQRQSMAADRPARRAVRSTLSLMDLKRRLAGGRARGPARHAVGARILRAGSGARPRRGGRTGCGGRAATASPARLRATRCVRSALSTWVDNGSASDLVTAAVLPAGVAASNLLRHARPRRCRSVGRRRSGRGTAPAPQSHRTAGAARACA